jgi:soluble lytic murein transglycosylase
LGARYLRKLLDWFAGNLALAAAGYNAGPSAVERWITNSPGLELDLFVARIPYEETRAYVERVVGNHARYRYLAGGESAVPKVALSLPTVDLTGQELY